MGKVSAAEADYIRKGISEGLRSDGRSASQHRRILLECDTVQQSNGSASCSIGGTQVIVAVRVSVLFHVSVSTACCWDLSMHLYCLPNCCLGGTQTVVPSIMAVRVSIREWALLPNAILRAKSMPHSLSLNVYSYWYTVEALKSLWQSDWTSNITP